MVAEKPPSRSNKTGHTIKLSTTINTNPSVNKQNVHLFALITTTNQAANEW